MKITNALKYAALLAPACLLAIHVQAQHTVPVKKRVRLPPPLEQELSGGFGLTTNGWKLFADYGKIRSDEGRLSDQFHDVQLFQVEFSEIKHPKETRVNSRQNNVGTDGKSQTYVFGKINNFYNVNLTYGRRRMIAGKPEPKTVSVHWVYAGGLSLGLLKPYYLEGYVPADQATGQMQLVRKEFSYEQYPGNFLNNDYIVGKAPFTKGLGEMKFVPGVHAKTALHFDFSNNKHLLMAVETGISATLYTRKIELLADQKAYPYSLNLYASFQIGKRW